MRRLSSMERRQFHAASQQHASQQPQPPPEAVNPAVLAAEHALRQALMDAETERGAVDIYFREWLQNRGLMFVDDVTQPNETQWLKSLTDRSGARVSRVGWTALHHAVEDLTQARTDPQRFPDADHWLLAVSKRIAKKVDSTTSPLMVLTGRQQRPSSQSGLHMLCQANDSQETRTEAFKTIIQGVWNQNLLPSCQNLVLRRDGSNNTILHLAAAAGALWALRAFTNTVQRDLWPQFLEAANEHAAWPLDMLPRDRDGMLEKSLVSVFMRSTMDAKGNPLYESVPRPAVDPARPRVKSRSRSKSRTSRGQQRTAHGGQPAASSWETPSVARAQATQTDGAPPADSQAQELATSQPAASQTPLRQPASRERSNSIHNKRPRTPPRFFQSTFHC